MKEVSILNQLVQFSNGNVLLNGKPTEYTYEIGKLITKASRDTRRFYGDWDFVFRYDKLVKGSYQSNTEELDNNTFIAASRDILSHMIYMETQKKLQ